MMIKILKILLLLLLAWLLYNNFGIIKQELKKSFHVDYCNEIYKGRGDMILKCINE